MGEEDEATTRLAGMAVKRNGANTIVGLAIPFGGPIGGKDLTRTAFGPETDLCIEWFGKSGRPLLYNHGLTDAIKTATIGRQSDTETDNFGVWAESELATNRAYRKEVDRLIEQEALGYSSGSMSHLVQAKKSNGRIVRWPWVELSLTPVPANPDENVTVHFTKSADVFRHFEEAGSELPAAVRSVLSYLDEYESGLPDEPATYAEEGERVLLAVRAFTDRSVDLVSLRSGRVLSETNRGRLAELRDRIRTSTEQYQSALADLEELLTATDPEAISAGKRATLLALAEAVRADNLRRFGAI